ncbi:valine--tRNA ligase [Fibrella sp. HMF5335]|uniref:Valine--tRNA ligase n=1 Tax=Fibrella rubiginis TaxID=2817060 RepID=A0A939GKQ8_9BACT|nr:valine--tRNA ligase [Fibrella rubiginis]MBO0938222.1 valine--tRNA ligase [Fibrella rubiginis]
MIAKTYSPQEIEAKWYQYWLDNKLFTSTPDEREPYTIVIPPPNVTGVLHMGHMLNNTIQDVLIRKARMEGKNACWVPGTDHASIATEAKVVAMLKERGISKKDLSRDEFLAYAWEWKEKYGGIILQQLRKIGASCDWDRTRFTMDPALYESVIDVFVDLYNKGQIYRGVRMVNWDPQGKTAVSDEEVITKEVQQKLYYIKYEVVEGQTDSITIATVRPETIMADAAVAVNPNDERYKHLHGKRVRIPLINRDIPVILDEYVTMDFGTGGLKVTPAHDPNDYELGIKHNLPVIDLLADDGTLNEKAQILVGMDRFAARKAIVKMLEESGNLEKTEEYTSNVGFSERTNAVIEPKLSLQWFLKMEDLAKPALKAVMEDVVQLVPPKFKNMYRSWMEAPRDWCISRQLWWGQQIPAFYMQDGTIIVAKNKREALRKVQHEKLLFAMTEADLTQDEDVLDTWFSSWLWPISVFDGIRNPDNEEINYYYPTNDLVTAPEILFFWVARMIVAGYEYRGQEPFKNVYLTGIVRDKQGRKMSKSLGNSPDPLDLIDQYGADGVRTGMLFSSPAGNDLPFDEKLCEQGRNFCNKIWNAYRLVSGWTVSDEKTAQRTLNTLNTGSDNNLLATNWFKAKLNVTLLEIEDHLGKFRISDALQSIYKLIWDDFCSQYLELIKPAYNAEAGTSEPIDRETYDTTINLFERLMALAHPFMPFITEEIWQEIRERQPGESLCVAPFPMAQSFDAQILSDFELLFAIISNIRNIRNTKQIAPKAKLPLSIRTETPQRFAALEGLITKTAHTASIKYIQQEPDNATSTLFMRDIASINYVQEKPDNATSFLIKTDEFYIDLADELDVAVEIANAQKDLDYQTGFRDSVMKKLSNEKFVANAKPEVVERERQKIADADAKIAALQETLRKLRSDQ